MSEFLSASELTALISVILIDVTLAGDNAVVVAMAAAGLPAAQRRQVIVIGIAAATVLRIVFSLVTVQLLQLGGALIVAGGLLLLWVCWKLWRELMAQRRERQAAALAAGDADAAPAAAPQAKTFRQAVLQIVIADVSMSLDNVLAVAGAAREHMEVLIVGLALSVALMGLAATFIARLLERYHWIAYVGLAIILYVALKMIWDGSHELLVA
jgi:YjbE family integral membrane protein